LIGKQFGLSALNDARWAATFLYNVHYAHPGGAPVPLLAPYWSLSVEEQFYLVFPVLFALVSWRKWRASRRVSLLCVLGAISAASYTVSILDTSSNPHWAYVSPFTRAWELALGAMICVATPVLLRIPKYFSGTLTWLGLGAIVFSALAYDVQGTNYPGWRATIPVLGAVLVIVGGTSRPRFGAEALIGSKGFRYLGARSYSLYLWQWPTLILADGVTSSASLWRARAPAFVIALALSWASYRFIENPIRHLKASDAISVGIGVGVSVCVVVAASILIAATSP
jgi:peptidoglycan/LPS O-acetylase OafA/YrhL